MGIFNFLKSSNDKHKSLRVKTNIGDKYINVELGQTYESLDILSLRIFQKDLYRLFDSDYGVIVGRVTGSGVGLPNCRVSIFVPIDETEVSSPITLDDIKKIEALSIYPYQTTFDTDDNGKIFNLLPKYSRNRNFNDFPDNEFGIGATPKTPVGTFPEKEEVLANETLAYVYDKYLKFTTLTNDSGDYILTVPANRTYTVTMCADITDIGKFSTTPALLKLEGYPDSFFVDENTKINDQLRLETLPNIDIQNITQYVKPLWSQDETNTNVGINRLDFKLNKQIKPFVTVFGNYFTPGNRTWWGDRIIFRLYFAWIDFCIGAGVPPADVNAGSWVGLYVGAKLCAFGTSWVFDLNWNMYNTPGIGCNDATFALRLKNVNPYIRFRIFQDLYCTLNGGRNDYDAFQFIYYGELGTCSFKESNVLDNIPDDLFIQSHKKGNLLPKVFTVKNTVDDLTADILNNDATPATDGIYTQYSYDEDIGFIEPKDYVFYQNNGSFIALLNCNRNKVVTNENGDLVSVANDSPTGVYIGFRGYFYLTNEEPIDNPPSRNRTGKIALKIPQSFEYGPIYQTPSQAANPLQYPNQSKWIWKHHSFEAGKLYSVAQYIYVKNSKMPTLDEQKEDTGSIFSPFDSSTWGYSFDREYGNPPANGFEEQTNIIYFGQRDKDETGNPAVSQGQSQGQLTNDWFLNSVAYQRHMNLQIQYSDMYNHITIPGRDLDPDTIPASIGPNGNGTLPPPPPPPPSISFTNITKLEDNHFSTTNGSQNNTNTIYSQRYVKQNYSAATLQVLGGEYDEVKYSEYYYNIGVNIANLQGTIQNNFPSLTYSFKIRKCSFNLPNSTSLLNDYTILKQESFSVLQQRGDISNITDNSVDIKIKLAYDEIVTKISNEFGFNINNNFAISQLQLLSSSPTKRTYTAILNTELDIRIKLQIGNSVYFETLPISALKTQLIKDAILIP